DTNLYKIVLYIHMVKNVLNTPRIRQFI
ncbi:hypothetical protein, partial [Plasmodium yoelii yoelii]